MTERSEVVLRVRDTGIGMSEKDIETALEPFRQLATSARCRRHRARPAADQGAGGGQPRELPHHAARRNAGTLVEIAFPATQVLAERAPTLGTWPEEYALRG